MSLATWMHMRFTEIPPLTITNNPDDIPHSIRQPDEGVVELAELCLP